MFQICVKGVWFIGGQLLISVPFFFLRENKSWNQWLKATRAKDVSSEHVLFLGNFLFFFFFGLSLKACRILVLQPGIEPMPPTVKAQS